MTGGEGLRRGPDEGSANCGGLTSVALGVARPPCGTRRNSSGPICAFSYFRLWNEKRLSGLFRKAARNQIFNHHARAEILADSPFVLVVEDEFFLQADLDDALPLKSSLLAKKHSLCS
jgi:hypothetical protein